MSDGYIPKDTIVKSMPEVSGNQINGVGEAFDRQANPFLWHPEEMQTHGNLKRAVLAEFFDCTEVAQHYAPNPPGGRGPELIPVKEIDNSLRSREFAQDIKNFALQNEGDLIGIAEMDPSYVYKGYQVDEPWIVVIGVCMDYDELSEVPSSSENPRGAVEIGKQYNRASRAARKLANYIREQGYYAKPYEGPSADAINMLPAAISAGLGELGKHGSLINDRYGSNFRLAAIATSMPLIPDSPIDIGAEDFCLNCQVCTNACPPKAISNDKKLVRGNNKWYVDFDKCIPYFAETFGCGICIAKCPWSFPDRAEKLRDKMIKRRERKFGAK